MEEQNNNGNNVGNNPSGNSSNPNGQNGQYTFFSMKDDHGFNDHIPSKAQNPKKALSGWIIFTIAMIIVCVCAVMLITGAVTRNTDKSNYYNTYNSIVETRNRINNRIQDLRN